jgi:hypothetical protein
MTVCRLGKQTLFELRRSEAAAIALSAELFTPTGCFVKAQTDKAAAILSKAAKILGTSIVGNTFHGGKGIRLNSSGGFSI